VLVPQSSLLYEARVLRVRRNDKRGGREECFIHYQGWNKKWDEWMPASALQKFQEGLAAQSKAGAKGGGPAEKGKKRKKPAAADDDDFGDLVRINIPGGLKQQLILDWDQVTREKRLVALPRSPSVDAVLEAYLVHKERKPFIEEIADGLRTYFNRALSPVLLYQEERSQCAEALGTSGEDAGEGDEGEAGGGERKDPSAVYGAEHLLRLFVKLPELLPYTNLDEESLQALQKRLEDFLRFLQKNHSDFFLKEYGNLSEAAPAGEPEQETAE